MILTRLRPALLFFLVSSLSLALGCATNQAAIGAAGATGATGAAGLTFLGAYDATRNYVPTDVVTFQGSTFVALASFSNTAPTGSTTSSSNWALLAQAGQIGSTGAIGATGNQGFTGPVGAQGINGLQGVTGAQGVAGVTGAQGVTGPQGAIGLVGQTGIQGAIGATGPQGLVGFQGIAGSTGPTGSQGLPGITGAVGPTGAGDSNALTEIGNAINASSPVSRNIFDASRSASGYFSAAGAGSPQHAGAWTLSFTTDYMLVAGLTSVTTNGYLPAFDGPAIGAWYDAEHNFISNIAPSQAAVRSYAPNTPPGTSIAVPSGAFFVRLDVGLGGDDGSRTFVPAATFMVVGNTTLPAAYVGFSYDSSGSATSVQTNLSALTAKLSPWSTAGPGGAPARGCWIGDSITGFNTQIPAGVFAFIGATNTFVDGNPGRTWAEFNTYQNQAFDSAAITPAIAQGCDLLIIQLGTNLKDGPSGPVSALGSPTDTPSNTATGTLAANVRYALETIQGWNPALRIVVLPPYPSGQFNTAQSPTDTTGLPNGTPPNANSLALSQNIASTIRSTAKQYSIPVLHWDTELGINIINAAYYFNNSPGDYTHPGNTMKPILIRYTEEELNRYSIQ